jgi:hypothetical protein
MYRFSNSFVQVARLSATQLLVGHAGFSHKGSGPASKLKLSDRDKKKPTATSGGLLLKPIKRVRPLGTLLFGFHLAPIGTFGFGFAIGHLG